MIKLEKFNPCTPELPNSRGHMVFAQTWSKPASENGQRKFIVETLPSCGNSPPPHHATSHQITPHHTTPHHITPNLSPHHTTTSPLLSSHLITLHNFSPHHPSTFLTTSHHISIITPQIKWGSRPTQPSAQSTNIIY